MLIHPSPYNSFQNGTWSGLRPPSTRAISVLIPRNVATVFHKNYHETRWLALSGSMLSFFFFRTLFGYRMLVWACHVVVPSESSGDKAHQWQSCWRVSLPKLLDAASGRIGGESL